MLCGMDSAYAGDALAADERKLLKPANTFTYKPQYEP